MRQDANSQYIAAYELAFESGINWNKPVIFSLATIDRIDKTESGRARFTISGSAIEPVGLVMKALLMKWSNVSAQSIETGAGGDWERTCSPRL